MTHVRCVYNAEPNGLRCCTYRKLFHVHRTQLHFGYLTPRPALLDCASCFVETEYEVNPIV